MRSIRLVPILLSCALWLAPTAAHALNLFEWSAVAEVVVSATVTDNYSKFAELRIDEALRGGLLAGDVVRVDLRLANRVRERGVHPRALRLDPGRSYVVLLRRMPPRKKERRDPKPRPPLYALVRDVDGVRELPPEGAEAVLAALRRFVTLQDEKDELRTWIVLRDLLEDTNPIVVQATLEQFLKFRRGEPELLADLRPLLEHPSDALRERAVDLIGQILAEDRLPATAGLPEVQGELAARARRDPTVAVRVAATRALGALEGESVARLLDEIAASDPEQAVRYAAERLIYERSQHRSRAETSD